MERILELVAEHFEPGIKSEMLTERIRQGLAMQISSALAENGVLKVIEVDGETEELLSDAVDVDLAGNMTASLDPDIMNVLIQNATRVIDSIQDPEYNNVILCTAPVRLLLQHIFQKSLPSVRVISYNELSRNVRLEPLGQLGIQEAILEHAY
jgi:flagellar biosynthesis component FlhA